LTEALDGLADRLGIEEVQSLRLLLKQSEELGASIATSLRVFSDEMRDKRLMRAETKAHALPVKMTLPLGLFIFPVILLVIMLPVVIRIKNAFV
jgi:tight adherence protein C